MPPSAVIVAVLVLMCSCCINVVSLEYLIKRSPGCGNMIVFFQFLFVATEGLIFQSKFGRVARIIPFKNYIFMVVLFFSGSVTNIMALNCDIPMPLHMIFKSGSLVANMFLGYIVLKKTYNAAKVISVALVSVGICICTFATTGVSNKTNSTKDGASDDILRDLSLTMIGGIFLLICSLLIAARLGIYQETLFKTYGNQSREATFYNHVIPLPFFAILGPSIVDHMIAFNQSPGVAMPLLGVVAPVMWQHLLVNLATQYVCIRSIFFLTTQLSSLTVTLLVTLRKFLSLVISVFYFGNEFSARHWTGAAFVFLGTLIYADLLPGRRVRRAEKSE